MICQLVGCDANADTQWTLELDDIDIEVEMSFCAFHSDVVRGSAILEQRRDK